MQQKIKSLQEILPLLESYQKEGIKVVQCHGVFDLLHPGHIRHLQTAKSQGDKLIVTVTPDRYVNKGPGRPAFNEDLRMETLASLSCVDYVVLNDTPDAVGLIRTLKPSIYAKGAEYQEHASDITGKIGKESEAAIEVGGSVYYTEDLTFSSSSLINRFLDPEYKERSEFLKRVKSQYTLEEILGCIEALSTLKVLLIGDAILDEYQYVNPLGQSGKGVHMVARCLNKEVFLGGSMIIANHLSSFVHSVTLLSAVGEKCPYRSFIHEQLEPSVAAEFIPIEGKQTLTKKRYVLQDGTQLTKLFETYSGEDLFLDPIQTEQMKHTLEERAQDYDLILIADFGNGLMNPSLIHATEELPTFLALNTQTNSGNRGYNVVTRYRRAEYISLNEPELRLAAHDRHTPLEELACTIGERLGCLSLSVTRGVGGVLCYGRDKTIEPIPALTTQVVDRVGAGDSYFALSSLCAAKGYSPLLSGFLGSLAAALDVQVVGNKESIHKVALCKFLTRLMK